jgi:hypothetical protein
VAADFIRHASSLFSLAVENRRHERKSGTGFPMPLLL